MTTSVALLGLGAGLLSASQITSLLLGLGILLIVARILGEIAESMGQPAVIGELLAGILLGPSVLGQINPDLMYALLPIEKDFAAVAFEGFTVLAITLYLLVAGMEVDLSTIWKQGRAAAFVGATGVVFPFAIGFAAAWFFPSMLGMDSSSDTPVFIFALFLATALSISALPVIAKTLMDLNMFKSDFGMIIISAAVFNDLIGWIIFAVILGMLGADKPNDLDIVAIIGLTLGFAVFCLTVLRWAIHRSLPWIQAHTSWPAGVLSLAMGVALLGAAFTEWLGVHAIFGAFLVGVAIGDSPHLRTRTRATLEHFISFIFAPLFFASVGLMVDFASNFDLGLVLVVLAISMVGKVLGCGLGARWSGMAWQQSWAVGFGMNARGTMEIILGLLALQFGLINEPLFVALVVMALVTSMISGPAMQRILRRHKPLTIGHHLTAKSFRVALEARTRREAIEELSAAVAPAANMDAAEIANLVWLREEIMPTGLANGIAVPHARVPGLERTLLAVGLTRDGIDFNASDGKSARLVFMILTPENDYSAQLEILKDIGVRFHDASTVNRAVDVKSHTEFLALLKTTDVAVH